jgi:alkylation response protein AidB-like acyl-CoA dehydrogenase
MSNVRQDRLKPPLSMKRHAAGRDLSGRRPAKRDLDDQLARVAAALAEGVEKRDLSLFYEVFRSTDLPFLVRGYTENQRGLYRALFQVLHCLGSISPALGLGMSNHYYVLAALVACPHLRGYPEIEARRWELFELILKDRKLIVNTNARVHTDQLGNLGFMARREDGGFRINGSAAYMSIASQGDIMFFIAMVENEGPAILVASPRDNPEIEIGPLLFPTAVADSDTRRITLHNLFLPAESALVVGLNEAMSKLSHCQLAWAQALLAASFLGAAARAIEEARRFLRSVRGPHGGPLAELDGMIVDIGRLGIRYRTACCMAHQAGLALEALAGKQKPSQAEVAEAFDLACAAKQVAGRCAEEVVAEVRRIIGNRAFTGGHPLERLSQEVIFCPLGGEVNAAIDRSVGRKILGEDDFMSNRW